MTLDKKSISLIDDNAFFLSALANFIISSGNLSTKTQDNPLNEADENLNDPSDIAIVDIHLSRNNVLDLINTLNSKSNKLTNVCNKQQDDEYDFNDLDNNSPGNDSKSSPYESIIDALKKIASSDTILSQREVEVIQLSSKGLQHKEIAFRLGVSTETVKKHMRNIYQKLQVQNKVEAINKYKSNIEIQFQIRYTNAPAT